MIAKLTRFIFRELIYSGHLQSLSAVSIVLFVAVLLQTPITASLLITTYLIFQAIYYFDRWRDLRRDSSTNKTRSHHLATYARLMPSLVLALPLIAMLNIFIFSNLSTLMFFGLIFIFGLLYPLLFKNLTGSIPLFKNFFVALVFALLVFLPNLYHHSLLNLSYLSVTLFVYLFAESLISQLILDLKDETNDRQRGLKTLPALVGRRQAIRLIYLISLITYFSAIIAAYITKLPTSVLVVITITTLANLLSLQLLINRPKYSFIVAAGKYLLWPLHLLL